MGGCCSGGERLSERAFEAGVAGGEDSLLRHLDVELGPILQGLVLRPSDGSLVHGLRGSRLDAILAAAPALFAAVDLQDRAELDGILPSADEPTASTPSAADRTLFVHSSGSTRAVFGVQVTSLDLAIILVTSDTLRTPDAKTPALLEGLVRRFATSSSSALAAGTAGAAS